MTSNTSLELAPLVLTDKEVGPCEIIDRIAIVRKSRTGANLRIVRIQRTHDDDTMIGHVMRENLAIKKAEHVWRTMLLQKPGVFIGSIRLLERATVGDAIDRAVAVHIKTIEKDHHKDLEKAIADPSTAADWSSYVSDLDDLDNLPLDMEALIVQWRPTKKGTRQVLKATRDLLARAGVVLGLHFLFGGDAVPTV